MEDLPPDQLHLQHNEYVSSTSTIIGYGLASTPVPIPINGIGPGAPETLPVLAPQNTVNISKPSIRKPVGHCPECKSRHRWLRYIYSLRTGEFYLSWRALSGKSPRDFFA